MTETNLREAVRRRYAEAASGSGCCDSSCDATSGSYSAVELASIPKAAVGVSLGCGNPTAVADLEPGETVLDLGSGGGIDVLLAAQRVGPTGFVYGLDMTEEMLSIARAHARESGVGNVEFLGGLIEEIPLPDESIDVVISNCVINLSVDKGAVFTEIHRVLRSGGRIGISDIVAHDDLDPTQRAERGNWVGCIAGALSEAEYRSGLAAAGFTDVDLTATHAVADGLDSMIVRAVKPR